MGTIHQLPTDTESQVRLLEKLVTEIIAKHPDAQVAKRWQAMARETMERYPGPPMPSQPHLNLDQVKGLTSEQAAELQKITEQWLSVYFDDVRAQMMRMHRDLLTLQKSVAEFEVTMQ